MQLSESFQEEKLNCDPWLHGPWSTLPLQGLGLGSAQLTNLVTLWRERIAKPNITGNGRVRRVDCNRSCELDRVKTTDLGNK